MHVHNFTKIQGLDLEKITSCQNVFNLHASSQDSFAYIESRHGSYPQFPWSPLGTPGTPLFATNQQKKMAAILESHSAKGSLTNNISQHVGSSTETHVPYQSLKNVNANVENQTKL